jgi:WD40 repeat protein
MRVNWHSILLLGVAATLACNCAAAEVARPGFSKDVAPIFARYCVGCHNGIDQEGELSLESFHDLQKGGSRGAVIVPDRADASLLIRALLGEVEPKMPPEDNERPTEAEIATLRAWIDAGAKGPEGAEPTYPEISVPEIESADDVPEYLTSLAISPDGKRLALGRYRRVELVDLAIRQVVARTETLPGKVNGLDFSDDGSKFVAATGVPGLYGVATICRTADGSTQAQIKGHRDALYDARFSPDGQLLATCSHDRQINLWDVTTGELVRTLTGHNGAVFELAFSADGSSLASASADGTVKIWDVATGERLDTLGQPEGGQTAVTLSPDDAWIVAGGADRQVRKWRLLSRGTPQINPLVFSRTSHDSSITKLAFSADGSTLVSASEGGELILWDAAKLIPRHRYEPQPDVITGLVFAPGGKSLFVARINGSWQEYTVPDEHVADLADDDHRDVNSTVRPTLDNEAQRFEGAEQEPNNAPAIANEIAADAVVRGVIGAPAESGDPDVDVFRFPARAGQHLVLEINAARQKSPLDSHIEVLDADGFSIPRVVLQAVRPTYFTFRGHDSTSFADFRLHKWQDMELNEYLYANGEVVKLWLYPRGPDSGFLVYPGIEGSRYAYFGTTSIAHSLNEPCYIVQPHPPGTRLIPNGLPEYTLYYENDDDGWRKLGADSRISFTAPDDGEYLVRVADVRGLGGDEYKYELGVREPRPDFHIKVKAEDLTINAGSGKEFSVIAERIDDFEGEITVEISGLPTGFHASNPIVIQAGQTTAYGTIVADADAPSPTEENSDLTKFTATAIVNGEQIVKDPVSLGKVKLAPRPKLLVHVLPPKQPPPSASTTTGKPLELIVAPGQTISAVVRLERNGFDGEVTFGNEYSGRNLPHGVYIDNIGLNGLTLLQGETEREFFITVAKWVPETTRMFHLRAEVEGKQTSWPVMLKVQASTGGAVTLVD